MATTVALPAVRRGDIGGALLMAWADPQVAAAVPALCRASHSRLSDIAGGSRRCGMSLVAGNTAKRPAPALLAYGFRPFFLGVGLLRVVAECAPSRLLYESQHVM